MKIEELRKKMQAAHQRAKGITDKADAEKRDLSEAEEKDVRAALAEIDKIKGQVKLAEDMAQAERDAAPAGGDDHEERGGIKPGDDGGDEEKRSTKKPTKQGIEIIPPTVRRYGQVRSFSGATRDEKETLAYRFGVFFAASQGRGWAQRRAKEIGIELRVHTENDDNKGGVLVPDEFENALIDLRETYGVFRRYTRVVPMTRDTKNIPRRTGGLTAYFVGEGATITESTKTWNNVKLTAKKLAALAMYSNELAEDAIVSIGDDVANEMIYAFSEKEDQCGFNGDGTSTYGGITGVCPKLKGLSGTIANIAGLVVGAGNAYSELTLANFNDVVSKLPQYADTPSAAWYVHKTFYHSVMEKLALAAGGVTAAEVVAGARQFRFLGYPVVFSQVLPKTEANSQVCALLGDLSLATKFGDRRQSTIAMSDSALNAFEKDEIAIRGTERFDIVVHDVGNASATAADRVPGPVVGLITAAS